MRKFDYSFLAKGFLPANLMTLSGNIYALRGFAEARKDNYAKVFTELESVARVQSVKSSNAIEGIVTTDRRIAEIVNRSSAPLNHDEAEIVGYRDALNIIHTEFRNLDFRRMDILSLHRTMLQVSGCEYAGEYKESDNLILEVDACGNRSVRFRPTPAAETETAMEQLELAYFEAKGNSDVNRLLLIPCVILDFLCIHPFQDGNGRMSRLLSLLLLYKNGFDVGKYISFEEQINKRKADYYEALKKSSAGWESGQNDCFPFVLNFLSTLYACYRELDMRFAVLNGRRVSKAARIEATVLQSLTPLSKRDICDIHPDISPTTVEAVLGAMVRDGRIRKIGESKGVRYVRNETT